MAFHPFHLINFHVYHVGPSIHRFHRQVLKIQRRLIHSLLSHSPPQVIHQTSPISLDNDNDNFFPLPLHFFHQNEPSSFPIYVTQLLSSFNIDPVASEVIARMIVLISNQVTNGNLNASFYIVAVVDYAQFTWMPSLSFSTQRSTINEVKMMRLEEIEKDLEDCSICLEEFSCSNGKAVVKIPCGHVYHESCILRWLNNGHSCPLCRRPILPLEN